MCALADGMTFGFAALALGTASATLALGSGSVAAGGGGPTAACQYASILARPVIHAPPQATTSAAANHHRFRPPVRSSGTESSVTAGAVCVSAVGEVATETVDVMGVALTRLG